MTDDNYYGDIVDIKGGASRYKLRVIVVGPLDVNCYLLWDSETMDGVVIDAGGHPEIIEGAAKKEGVNIKRIIQTHCHFDHIGGIRDLKEALNIGVTIHKDDEKLLTDAPKQGAVFGRRVEHQCEADDFYEDGDGLEYGSLKFQVIHTPGHTPGGVCLLFEPEKLLFTGDTLFAGSIGRWDLPGGDFDILNNSLKTKLFPLSDDVRVFPGHGPDTTIGDEKELNPFMSNMY